jgi:hypothetical protein
VVVSTVSSLGDNEQGVFLQRPCQFCGRLVAQETCLGCQRHREVSGHFPKEVRWQQVPGQPRVLARFCSECERELPSPD